MEKMQKLYHDLIRINSVSGNEKEIALFIGSKLEEMGLVPRYSQYKDMENSLSVSTSIDSGKPGKKMLLIGHIDTVAFGEGWDTDPLEPTIVDDRTYARGAMDMKGGLTAVLETLEYFVNHKDEFNGEIVAAFVADEEVLSRGTYQLAAEGLTADYAIMAECRFDNVAIGFRGRYSIDVIVSGESTHTQYYPNKGENAIVTAAKLIPEIEKLSTLVHPKLKHGTWCVRHIEGGNAGTLVVPDRCQMLVERFVVPGESYESCEKQLKDLVKEMGIEDKVEIRLRPRELPYMEPFSLPEDHELVLALQKNYKDVCNKDLPVSYDMSVCDTNILVVTLGIPTVTFGPSGGNMHGANEYGYFDHIVASKEIYIRTVKDILK
ncbi:MAG: M20/M25/M40 family metallo-hydrolase [Tissierellia bacterium]|nr:M20/M25/M40 family metallo-hydrolase [Bacillota bacterium]NLL22292.1 M20/M25/M40 family metallo-hydrolase [Tissierellia bacterium]